MSGSYNEVYGCCVGLNLGLGLSALLCHGCCWNGDFIDFMIDYNSNSSILYLFHFVISTHISFCEITESIISQLVINLLCIIKLLYWYAKIITSSRYRYKMLLDIYVLSTHAMKMWFFRWRLLRDHFELIVWSIVSCQFSMHKEQKKIWL